MRDVGLTARMIVPDVKSDRLEVVARFVPGPARVFGVRLRCSEDGGSSVSVCVEGDILHVADVKVPLGRKLLDSGSGVGEVDLRIFLDGSVLEVFAMDGRVVVTTVVSCEPEDTCVEVFGRPDGAHLAALDLWRLNPAECTHWTI